METVLVLGGSQSFLESYLEQGLEGRMEDKAEAQTGVQLTAVSLREGGTYYTESGCFEELEGRHAARPQEGGGVRLGSSHGAQGILPRLLPQPFRRLAFPASPFTGGL